MKVLLLGSGGREHALYWKLSQSSLLSRLDVFPGNGGFPPEAIVTASLDLNDLGTVVAHVRRERYDLVVVGPEQPLVDGIADRLSGICPVFGPTKTGAMLEGSKDFSKSFMERHGIPTARSRTFVHTELRAALDYLHSLPAPLVVKADGLAAGKGVVVADTHAEAEEALRDRLERGVFGEAGRRVLIEEFMPGAEASVFAICDGERAIPFLGAQDHKRAYDGNLGPNTGGMGAYLPVPLLTPEILEQVQREVLDRTVAGMRAEGAPYRGLLYAGLMIHAGKVRVVEFNARFGDPETQAILRLLDEDLLARMRDAAGGCLSPIPLKFRPGAALVVVVAAEGYPGTYRKNILLKGIDGEEGDIIFFHAGTRREGDRVYSTGGRVLGVTATGSDLAAARAKVYGRLKSVDADGLFYRQDIGIAGPTGSEE